MANLSGRFDRTWDGLPVTKERPYGVAVVVYRYSGGQLEFLVLHRNIYGPDYDGEWAWGPPSGARQPGESVDQCATRELLEESGLSLVVQLTSAGSTDWVYYAAEASHDAQVRLSEEHDRYAWLPLERAAALVTPEYVRAWFLAAARLVVRP